MRSKFFNRNVLSTVGCQSLEVAGFLLGILPTYYLLSKSDELEKDQVKYYANAVGVIGYGIFCSFVTRTQSKPSRIAVAKMAEVGVFVGASIGAEILFNHFNFSQKAVLFGSQSVGITFYTLAAFIKNKLMRNELSMHNTTKEAAKKSLGQFSEIAGFVAGILLMSSLEMPFYSAYLVGLSFFAVTAWIKTAVTYEPVVQPYNELSYTGL